MRMFGGLAFLVGGNMAVAASGQGGLMLRVEPDQTEQLAAEPHAGRFVMRGKEMTGWLRVDAAGVESDEDLARWADIGVRLCVVTPPEVAELSATRPAAQRPPGSRAVRSPPR